MPHPDTSQDQSVAIAIGAVVFGMMLIEARRASRNERRQRARGGVVAADDAPVYAMMQVAYPAAFASMLAELAARGGPRAGVFIIGAAVFSAAKALKWWAIRELGPCWTFRVIVVPGVPLVNGGPYRYVRHPNYIGVFGELAGAALMSGAVISGPIATAAFTALMARRIAVEQRALDAARDGAPASKEDDAPASKETV
jgi:methyltransferase